MMTANARKVALSLTRVAGVSLLGAGADKPGSKGWCKDMSAISKGKMDRRLSQNLRRALCVGEHHNWQRGPVRQPERDA